MNDIINKDGVVDLEGREVHHLDGVVVIGFDYDELEIAAEGYGVGRVGRRGYLRGIVGQISESW